MKRISLFLLAVWCGMALGAGCDSSPRKRVVKIGLVHSPTHSFTLAFRHFAEALEKETGGRYEARIYHSQQLGGEREMQEMLAIGSLEITVTGVLNIYQPLYAVFELPYLYTDREHVKRVMQGHAMNAVSQSLIPFGLRQIGFYENGFRHITNSKRPIHAPEDIKGLSIRTPENPAQVETFKALGANPRAMSFSELYTALAQGVVDGQENPLQNIFSSSLYEVQTHLAMTGHIYNSAYVIVSERFWQSIPEEDRVILKACMDASSQWQLRYMEAKDRELEILLKEKGMQFTTPDQNEFEKAARPAYDALCGELGPQAVEIVREIEALQ